MIIFKRFVSMSVCSIMCLLCVGTSHVAAQLITADPEFTQENMQFEGMAPIMWINPSPPPLLDMPPGYRITDVAEGPHTPAGPDLLVEFDAYLSGPINVDMVPVVLEAYGPTQMVILNKVGNTTGTFNAEIISMDLFGNTVPPTFPIQLREAPPVPSMGQVDIQDLGGGLFSIDSFFDVFIEISVDGGNTWLPPMDSSTIVLMAALEARILSFTADFDGKRVLLHWETGSEVDLFGFNIFKQEIVDRNPSGKIVQLNKQVIPCHGDPMTGMTYEFCDENILPQRTFSYSLEAVDLSGQKEDLGSVIIRTGKN